MFFSSIFSFFFSFFVVHVVIVLFLRGGADKADKLIMENACGGAQQGNE